MVRVGLIGCGRWGQNHARTLASLPCHFVGIADPDSSRKEIADDLNVLYFLDFKELVHLVDAVVVATPTAQHFSVARYALENGVHALVEKPMTLSLETTRALMALAAIHNVVLSAGYIYRFNPIAQALRSLIHEAHIHYIHARYTGGQNRLWSDGGAILNFGIHLVDTLNFILQEHPLNVFAVGVNRTDKDREDSAAVMLRYRNFVATLELSCVTHIKTREITIVTDAYTAVGDLNLQALTMYSDNAQPTTTQARTNPLTEELAYFLDAVEKKQRREYFINVLGEENLTTVIMCEAAAHSAKTNQPVAI